MQVNALHPCRNLLSTPTSVFRQACFAATLLQPIMSSSSPSSSEGGALQARPEAKVQIIWYGGENADQDVAIRLVSNRVAINDDEENDEDHTLAIVKVHSSRLVMCSGYFAAISSHRWGSKRKRNPEEIIFHVDDDLLELHIDCFTYMCSPLVVQFKDVKHSLELLRVATQLVCDNLMSSICLYLVSKCPWSAEDEIRIRISVEQEGFPRGHAADLLERLGRRVTLDDLRPLIASCASNSLVWLGPPKYSALGAEELLRHVLVEAAREQRPTQGTFVQVVATIIKEHFRSMLEAAAEELGMDEDYEMICKMTMISHLLDIILATGTTDQVILFVKYSEFPMSFRSELAHYDEVDESVATVVELFVRTITKLLKEVVAGSFPVGGYDRYKLLWNWMPLLEYMYKHGVLPGGVLEMEGFFDDYERVKEHLLSSLCDSEQIRLKDRLVL